MTPPPVEEINSRRGSDAPSVTVKEWRAFGDKMLECRALVCPEDEGGFAAYSLRLQGVASQGETENEAVENLADAFRETILAYEQLGTAVPWSDVEICRSDETKETWFLVDV